MSFDVNWDVDKYREDYESEDHWHLRKAFMEKWKQDYPEERLVCLAKVFYNMEFMGCRYPTEVMHEVARLSEQVARDYRNSRKNKLHRTFVSASDAAEDRAKGVKREGGVIVEAPPRKSAKIEFVKPGQSNSVIEVKNSDDNIKEEETNQQKNYKQEKKWEISANVYLNEMMEVKCLDVKVFKENLFQTPYGRMVLLIRPCANKMWNIQASCQACGVMLQTIFENGCYSITIGGKLVARATGLTKLDAKNIVEILAWNRLREELISVIVKELWIPQGDARISVSDVSGKKANDAFGTPIENSVATKMMQMMGWKGGGLGADAQGIAEPIKPNLQMVNRAGLGSSPSDLRQLRRAAAALMQRYIASDTLDIDLVFSSEFSKEERAALHQCAQESGLASKSYGNKDRFLVVKKKLDPFSLVRAIIEKGGNTPKYQVFIPSGIGRSSGR